jgi:hypothetical protein
VVVGKDLYLRAALGMDDLLLAKGPMELGAFGFNDGAKAAWGQTQIKYSEIHLFARGHGGDGNPHLVPEFWQEL